MALRESTRRWTMRACQLVLVACVSALVALRVGRPLYYTDGEAELSGPELAASGMLQWLPPSPQSEVPGPVRGRIAALPDGRLLYGRATEDGSTDLVLWNPSLPTLPPERVHGLCSDGHDLAPAVGADGRVWFSSDRDGEGYELFVAPRLLASAAEVARVDAASSELDETDPAPSPDGRELVFARVDRTVAGGDDGELWRLSLDVAGEPERVFGRRDPLSTRLVDRDPVFAPDGAALWFVRKSAGEPLAVVRSSRLLDRYDEPLGVAGSGGVGALRSPLPLAGGRRLWLVQAEQQDQPLLYESVAREVYPWWPGQSALEWVLLGVAAFCLLILTLLHFGRRWATLDLVAQCLLLSLLLHLLLFALLKGLAIRSALQDGEHEDGAFEIAFASTASATSVGGAGGDVAAEVRFEARERAIAVAAPSTSELPTSSAVLEAGAGAWEREVAAADVAADVALQDAPAAMPVRTGADESTPAVAAALPAVARTSDSEAAEPERASAAESADRALRIAVPGSSVARPQVAARDLAPAAERAERPLAAREVATASPSLRDATAVVAAPQPQATAAESATSAKPSPSPVAAVQPGASANVPRAERVAAGPRAHPEAAVPTPDSALPRARASAPAAAAAAPPTTSLPSARAVPKPVATPRDARTALVPAAANASPSPSRATASPSPLAIAAPEARRFEAVRPQPRAAAPARADFAVPVPTTQLARVASRAPEVAAAERRAPEVKTAYSNRFGPQKAKALEQFGGTDETEKAVRDGLGYLARIQRADGSWGDPERFDTKYGMVYVGKTALCVLAFLGAGHTPQSRTEHSAVVEKAIAFLLRVQDADTGAFGPSSCYGHGISTYALAECYGMTKDEELLQPLERALVWILDHQGPRRDKRNRGGWGYFSPGLRSEDDYARVSVTSWMVMALESARMSGIEPPEDVLPAAKQYLELSFDKPNGWFRYNHEPSRLRSAWPTLPASTPAGAFCLQLLGAAKDDEMVKAALDFTVARRPEQYRRYDDDDFVQRGQGNVYFWYYGSLCCFLAGGDAWKQWNERLSTVLPKAQAQDGSFPPIDVYAQEAGDNKKDRSYTTAMCVLSLEVYYRYFTPLLTGR